MIVIDASVASKWILKGEKDQDKALAGLPKRHLARSLRAIFKTGLVIHQPVFKEILQAAIFALKPKPSPLYLLTKVNQSGKSKVI